MRIFCQFKSYAEIIFKNYVYYCIYIVITSAKYLFFFYGPPLRHSLGRKVRPRGGPLTIGPELRKENYLVRYLFFSIAVFDVC
jgi:hypothetical protein